MTYSAKETGVYSGNPVFLYRITRGGVNYDYCSLPEDLVLAGTPSGTFKGSSMTHGKIRVTQAIQRDELPLDLPLSDTLAQLFLDKNTTFSRNSITIWRGHYDDPDGEYRVVFKGKVRAAHPTDDLKVTLVCTSLFTDTRQNAPSGIIHPVCRWVLYHGGCRLSRATFEEAATVSAISDRVCTIAHAATKEDNFYTGGVLIFGTQPTLAVKHAGDQVTLRSIPPALQNEVDTNGSAAVTLAPGCNRSLTQCRDRFSNVVNFGGFWYMPKKDPWNDGSLV